MPKRRRRLSMTPLIDVIFLLLLFFMLSSTFSRFGEIDLTTGGAGAGAVTPDEDPLVFVRLSDTSTSLNGQSVDLDDLAQALPDHDAMHVVLSVQDTAKAQALADALFVLRGRAGVRVTVVR